MGLHLALALHRDGHKVTVLHRGLTQGQLPKEIEHLLCNRRDAADMQTVLGTHYYDAVFDISGYSPLDCQTVLQILDGKIGHYIFCSTVSVYAGPNVVPVSENAPTVTVVQDETNYASQKAACEELLQDTLSTKLERVTIVRPCYIYGPNNYLYREGYLFDHFRSGRPVILPGMGRAFVQMVHVADLARSFVLTLSRRGNRTELFNIANPLAPTIEHLLHLVGEVVNRDYKVIHLDPYIAQRYTDLNQLFPFYWDDNLVVSVEKAKSELGFMPAYALNDGLRMTYEWYLENHPDFENNSGREELLLNSLPPGAILKSQ